RRIPSAAREPGRHAVGVGIPVVVAFGGAGPVALVFATAASPATGSTARRPGPPRRHRPYSPRPPSARRMGRGQPPETLAAIAKRGVQVGVVGPGTDPGRRPGLVGV